MATTFFSTNRTSRVSSSTNRNRVGSSVSKKRVTKVTLRSLYGHMRTLVRQYGLSIFSEENESKLLCAFDSFTSQSALIIKTLKFLMMMKVVSRLYDATKLSQSEFDSLFTTLLGELVDFGIVEDKARVMIVGVAEGLGLSFTMPAAKDEDDEDVSAVLDENGCWTDSRDGNVYKTCKIGGQIWLAENLRYEPTVFENVYVYNNDYTNFSKWGYLYTWDKAAQVVPKGWHLPSQAEMDKMIRTVAEEKKCKVEDVIMHLASKDCYTSRTSVTTRIPVLGKQTVSGKSDPGLDSYGFGAYICGYYSPDSGFKGAEESCRLWTGSASNTSCAYELVAEVAVFSVDSTNASNSSSKNRVTNVATDNKKCAFSVRLIKDSD